MRRFRFFMSYVLQYKYSYIAGIFFMIVTNWIMVTIPYYIQLSIDLLTNNLSENHDLLLDYLITMLFLAFSVIIVRTLSRVLFFNPGRAIEFTIKNDLFTKLLKLQKDYYSENATGSIISRMNNDITGVRLICGFGMMQFFNILTSLTLTPYMMWKLSPTLTLYCLAPIAISFLFVRLGMRILVKNTRQRMTDLQNLSAFTVSNLTGIDVIKNFQLRDWSLKKFDKHNFEILDRSIKISWVRSFIMPILRNLENFLKILILSVGGFYVLEGKFSIGELTAYIAYAALLTTPLMGLGWLSTLFQQGMVGLESIETILNRKIPEETIQTQSKDFLNQQYQKGLKVKNLNFTYPESKTPTLQNISFELYPDQTLGILGKIGSGKTTLVNCLNKYLPVEDNHILLGDLDINQTSWSDWRSIIRTVTQEPFLFSDTVLSNVCFGQKSHEFSEEKWTELLKEIALFQEVKRFPDHEQTMVGEKGIMLSGGQKQRIALGRALVTPGKLLILDNVLSAVDYETENQLLQTICSRKYYQNLIIVSHRVRALEKADKIIVMDEGKVIQEGTHQELVEVEGFYQQTWNIQNQKEHKQNAS